MLRVHIPRPPHGGFLDELSARLEGVRLVDDAPYDVLVEGVPERALAAGCSAIVIPYAGVPRKTRELAVELGIEDANWGLAAVNLLDQRYEEGIAQLEAFLRQDGSPSSWVREMVTGARDRETGQAYLDRRIPEIVASMPEENAYFTRLVLNNWYLLFGFLDRYFEVILAYDLTGSSYTDADVLIYNGTLLRDTGFTAHPRYLEVAEATGLVETWEQRGPPDFCEKLGGQWVCE